MSRSFLIKYIFLLTTCIIFISKSAFGQNELKIRGQLLVDKKIVVGAAVSVYEGNKIVNNTTTNSLGKFVINVEYNKLYVIQFKKNTIPTQKVALYTKNSSKKTYYGVLLFTLSSKKSSKEGPSLDDVVTSFKIKESGQFQQETLTHTIEPIRKIDAKEENIDAEIKNLEANVEKRIAQVPAENRKAQITDYQIISRKKDSILLLAEQKAALMVINAQEQSSEIRKANVKLEQKYNRPIIDSRSNIQSQISNDLKRFALSEKKFLGQQNVKTCREVIEKFSKKKELSPNDSLEYLNNLLLFNEEMIKSAWLQLEVDKLNAKTKEDSLSLQQRAEEIRQAELKIALAKDKIEIQNVEIRHKNTVLIFVFVILITLAILFFMLYQNFKTKKKSNQILEKKNAEIAKQNKKILDSIRYAKTIQQAVLPIKTNIDKHFNWFLVFKPKDIVSGDFYWFNHFDETGKSVFAVVDCTGHGVPGAFMSMIGNRLLTEAVIENETTNPVEILEVIDNGIRFALMQDETSNNDGMDICVCTIDRIDDVNIKVCFAGAKRPLFYTDKQTDEIKYIKGTIRGIGGKKRLREKPKKPFEEHTFMLKKGDRLYMTTDGLFDLQSPNRKKFGRINFMTLLKQYYKKPLNEQYDGIIQAIKEHSKSEPQIDDITVIGIEL